MVGQEVAAEAGWLMFQALMKGRSRPDPEAAFDSTTFSLSTAVPRPAERREHGRIAPILRVTRLIQTRGEQLIRLRTLSAGGLMGDVGGPCEIGEAVAIEFSSQRIPAHVVWKREGSVGIKFDQSIDLGELLAGRKPRHAFRERPPRLEVSCRGSVRIGSQYHNVDVHDISLGGIKFGPIDDYCVGKRVTVVVESLRPIKGVVRWYSDRRAGVVFDRPLDFDELAEWVGKRLEFASLRASLGPPLH